MVKLKETNLERMLTQGTLRFVENYRNCSRTIQERAKTDLMFREFIGENMTSEAFNYVWMYNQLKRYGGK